MAQRRMISNDFVNSDAFLDMPLSAQALYFHLILNADDEGFINRVKKIMRMINANNNDLDILIGKRFLLLLTDEIYVIKHWLLHNSIRQDRFHETLHLDAKKMIKTKNNLVYSLIIPVCPQPLGNQMATTRQPNGAELSTRLGKVRLGKGSKGLKRIVGQNPDETDAKAKNIYSEIVNYLNQVLQTKYKPTSVITRKVINARLAEKYTLDDFKYVIDIKYKDWQGTDQQKYLRPETLFGNKFESYRNDKSVDKQHKIKQDLQAGMDWATSRKKAREEKERQQIESTGESK